MEVPEKAVEAFYVLQELMYMHSAPLALKAAVDLGIPDILAAAGPGASLTPHQIVEQLPRKSHNAADKVARILRVLAHKGVFAESEAGTSYGLNDVSSYFITGSKFDLTPYLVIMLRQEVVQPQEHLRELVEDDDASGFVLAFGSDFWSYELAHPDFSKVFHEGMRSRSNLLNTIIAHHYKGFRDVQCLVDVGGAVGEALARIVAAHPHIRGINFDVPHVISTASEIPGVEHVTGNFFESVPSGDAILLQMVLHDWEDENCKTILRNCHKALPEQGRLLIRDHVIEASRHSRAKTSAALNSDLLMLASCGGRERTRTEWTRVLAAGGFSEVLFMSLQGVDLIECVKT